MLGITVCAVKGKVWVRRSLWLGCDADLAFSLDPVRRDPAQTREGFCGGIPLSHNRHGSGKDQKEVVWQ